MFENTTIMLVGGTGSWGRELLEQLLHTNAEEIRIFSRNEDKQAMLRARLGEEKRVTFLIGDIRDRGRLLEAFEGVDVIYHLAALKHVPICEDAPMEAVKTNIMGVQNVIDAALACSVSQVICVSTDKAAEPTGVYGYTKAIAEKLMLDANVPYRRTKFSVMRSGNVLGSDGSVIPMFYSQLEQCGRVRVTDPQMSRYFITGVQAAERLIEITEQCIGGEVFIMKMPAVRIGDLAKAVLSSAGRGEDEMEEIGPRRGEKFSEVLVSEEERNQVMDFDERFYVIPPKQYLKYPAKKLLTTSGQKALDSSGAVVSYQTAWELLKQANCLKEAQG